MGHFHQCTCGEFHNDLVGTNCKQFTYPTVRTYHVTELEAFKKCPRSWYYRYIKGLEVKEVYVSHMWFGTLIHDCLAEYYSFGHNPVHVFNRKYMEYMTSLKNPTNDMLVKLSDYLSIGTAILDVYTRYAERNDDFFEVHLVEGEFKAPLSSTRNLLGTIDLVGKTPTGIVFFDHKTKTSFTRADYVALDEQMTAYCYLLWENYKEVPVGYYNQIRKKVPAEPLILKKGGLSKAQGIDTTYDRYLAAINEINEPQYLYEDVLATLENDRKFICREPVLRTTYEVQQFAKRANMWIDIIESREAASLYCPHYTENCAGCRYADLCRAQDTAGDTESIEQVLYKFSAVQEHGSAVMEIGSE